MLKTFLFNFLLLSVIYTHAQTTYQQEIDAWHTKRIESLKKEDGWLNLVGLYWLQQGKNTFGSGSNVQIKFPKNSITENAGWFELKSTTVILHANKETAILVNGIRKTDPIIFTKDSEKPIQCSYKNLRWTIIKREDKIGIRLRDINSNLVKAFKEIPYYPADSNFKIKAYLQKPSQQKSSIFITNIIGQTNAQNSPGKLVFTLNNQQYSLDALQEDNELFIVFGDATSGNETYPAGRFMYANMPDKDGYTILDFNKAFNPPCAFTPYATCPLPPKQNILPIAITAGEKNVEHLKNK
ncbi:MAG: DUF1684 domain-containing protein [Bacteroidetes bacterium]|nr:DUF1684 domain-containing protein [Bacteroidota bacterium]MBS1650006.1 DUF1684 domain-containing protein [Bacteroidota bacterium]